MSPALSLHEITKRYREFTAVDRFSLDVSPGEVLGFLGPNGAGKTTTIRMVMSILFPDSGTISVLGHPRAEEVKDRIGYLPEERGLYRKMSVEATLSYIGRLKGLSGTRLRQRIDEGLDSVGLKQWRRHMVESLSKGMQQKIQFVATLLHKPELVILDEPFSGLDPLNAELLEQLIARLRRDGVTVIFSTHQMELAERICDRIVLINRGRKVVEGTLAEIRRSFASRIVALDGEGDFDPLSSCPGVARAQITAGHARLELADGADPSAILAQAMTRARIRRFELLSPSLHEIFVRLVGDDGVIRDPHTR